MAGRWTVRRLGAMVVAALVYGIVLASATHAQGQDDFDRLLAEIERLHGEGKSAEAIPMAERAVAEARERHGEQHKGFSSAIGMLAVIYQAQGRYAEAEALLKQSLDLREKALGLEHIDVGAALNNLAILYREQRRYAEAEPLLRRAHAIAEKARGPEHQSVGVALNQLAGVLRAQRRYADAEQFYKRSLDIREKALGPEHASVGKALVGLAELYLDWNRPADAEPLLTRSLGIFEKALAADHPDVATTFMSLAKLHLAQGRHTEAEGSLTLGLGIYEKALGPEHPYVGTILNNLAMLAYSQRDWARAAGYMQRSTSIIERRARRGLAGGRTETSRGEAQRLGLRFLGFVKATYRAPAHRLGPAQTFEAVQWVAASEAAASIAQMAARSAKGSPRLAGLVRERQDLVSEWQLKDKLLIAAKSEEPTLRKVQAEKVLADRLPAIDTRLSEIDRNLAQEFPNYAALADPTPVSIAEVQGQLDANEALVLFLDTPEWRPVPEETFIWVVTKSEVRWARSNLGTAALVREVGALRCGLDATAWYGAGAERCAKALGIPLAKAPGAGQPLPFDHARAHKLYVALFGAVENFIKGKHLLIVPSGPLTQLPFHVLVTRPPPSGDHRAAAWLAREHAVSVLPAVSSLKALRRVGRPSAASRPMIGFGNPLLDGPGPGYAGLAKLARDKQRCPLGRGQRKVAPADPRGGVAQVEIRGGLADLSQIRQQIPLPETADELCDVARDVKADVARDIRLGAGATEREIKALSAGGDLAKYRMVHFATHGVLAGQLDGTHEPGLILTPPDRATEEDDGYLSASEIAALKLDADWVILSACNTAAGTATSAEAHSGLARAFIYAQARALLVSHWEVYSDATVKLITTAIREMVGDPKVGRAEALRRSMLALLDKGSLEEAHPAFWAPFVVVGEGAAAR